MKWSGTAITTDYFAGPSHTTPAGATVLALGRHVDLKSKVTVAGEDIVNTIPDAVTVA